MSEKPAWIDDLAEAFSTKVARAIREELNRPSNFLASPPLLIFFPLGLGKSHHGINKSLLKRKINDLVRLFCVYLC
jgi:chromosomal replication initiation ATPase DnaA